MKKETPYLVLYGCTYSDAMDIVHRRRLRHCELASDHLLAICFSEVSDLVLFKLRFHDEAIFADSVAVVHSKHIDVVMEFIDDYSLTERVDRSNPVGVWFYREEDEKAFNQEFGAVP
jgi:hypothetical protein